MLHGGDVYRNKVNIDFSVNLNPRGVPTCIIDSMREIVPDVSLYPDIRYEMLRDSLSNMYGISREMIYPGNGASELIMAIFREINPYKILLVEPGFTGYRHCINAVKMMHTCEVVSYMLNEEAGYELDEDFLDFITADIDLIVITNPINPVGKNIDATLLKLILDKAESLNVSVLIDESFYELSRQYQELGNRLITNIDKYSNLFVIRSFTKLFAIPGVRIAYCISNKEKITGLINNLPEWNVSQIAQAAGIACVSLLQNEEYIGELYSYIKEQRERLLNKLKSVGLKVFDSDTLYLLIKSDYDLYSKVLEQGILIRDCSDYIGLGKGYYRIAVKDEESNNHLLECIK